MPIDQAEILSRYVFTKKFLRSDNSVKWGAFSPRENTISRVKETSVYRINNLSALSIWQIGQGVGKKSNRTLKGRADFLTLDVLNISLDVLESEPPPKHANIIGWPDKADSKQLAMELAKSSQGFRFEEKENSVVKEQKSTIAQLYNLLYTSLKNFYLQYIKHRFLD